MSDLLSDSSTEKLSTRRIAEIAASKGVTVSNTSISKYLRAVPEKPSEKILQAFSLALNIPMTKLREAADLPAGEVEPFVVPESANRVNARQRELVLQTIRVLLAED